MKSIEFWDSELLCDLIKKACGYVDMYYNNMYYYKDVLCDMSCQIWECPMYEKEKTDQFMQKRWRVNFVNGRTIVYRGQCSTRSFGNDTTITFKNGLLEDSYWKAVYGFDNRIRRHDFLNVRYAVIKRYLHFRKIANNDVYKFYKITLI